ncbi:MAG TPA: DEAD/DEAH box helicase, partial [Anaerolineae bacterium]|nr:DEAD/DEAH box helicase [Anaerolineae bacterium]
MSRILMPFDAQQREIAEAPIESKVFLHGPAGAGKTTVGMQRMLHLLRSGVPAEAILVVVPQRTLAAPYYDALHSPDLGPGGQVTVVTMGGLARR